MKALIHKEILAAVLASGMLVKIGSAQGVNPISPQPNDLIQITKPAFANPSYFYTTPSLLTTVVTPPPTGNIIADTATVQTALTNIQAGGNIGFPCGTYNLNPITVTFANASASITIAGSGSDCTIFKFQGGTADGFTINYIGPGNSIHWANSSIVTAGTGGSGIVLNQTATVSNPGNSALSDFYNVTIRGADGYAVSNHWTNGILVSSVSNINFTNLTVVGNAGIASGTVGVNLNGVSGNVGVVYNFYGDTFNYQDKGIVYGQYIQGVTVTANNFTGGNYGIYWPAGTGTVQLAVSNSQFNNKIAGILDTGGVELVATSNTFLLTVTGAVGVHITTNSGAIISNNYFTQIGAAVNVFGIEDEGESVPSTFTGNRFSANAPAYWFPTTFSYATTISGNLYGAATVLTLGASSKVIADVPQVFASLPACGAVYNGRQAYVSDSTTQTWGATVTGSGTSNVLTQCNGVNWTVVGM